MNEWMNELKTTKEIIAERMLISGYPETSMKCLKTGELRFWDGTQGQLEYKFFHQSLYITKSY